MTKTQITIRGPWADVAGPVEAVALVRQLLTVESPGAQFTNAYKLGRWDGMVSLMPRGRSTFPAGLHARVAAHLAAHGYPCAVVEAVRTPYAPRDGGLRGVTIRPHQVRAADEAVVRPAWHRIESPTASGKTLIGAEICRRTGWPMLWLIHRAGVAAQTIVELGRFLGEPVGKIQGKVHEPERVTVGMVPTLAARIKARDARTLAYLSTVRGIVADEAHHGGADTWQAVIQACPHLEMCNGLSGTLPDRGALHQLRLEGVTGPLFVAAEYDELQSAGFIATPTIRLIEAPARSYPAYEDVREHVLPSWRRDARPLQKLGTKLFSTAYAWGIAENEARHEEWARVVAKHVFAGEKALVMCDLVDHAATMDAALGRRGVAPRMYLPGRGTTEAERTLALREFAELRVGAALVVTPWFREGMDLPAVDVGFLAGATAAEVALMQAVGRMLRVRPDKSTVVIYAGLDGRDPAGRKDYLATHTMGMIEQFRKRGWAVERAAGGW